ncbi:MAG: MarR family winged helix-turn-helix transcriptional regulator [Candidatus Accumulibacter sp.]|nr:helix-turn-helix domain-containing protein [Accumulibacter sp.]MCM8611969.1 MarR family winged helix-turn-helix transcriptional regulator [Accumulibacter sp.]MCM8635829.1 MarR family winged helix-turn-helix transcriptional regulator [Accumulibacter sp.]MCM8641945.1 MarR family winged helix-turn-helix transcriptional regulator [Accumulibacter sp.]
MWILQEVQRLPGLGVTDLAALLAIHQSTCSQLVEKLVARGYLIKTRRHEDQRRVGLHLAWCRPGHRGATRPRRRRSS